MSMFAKRHYCALAAVLADRRTALHGIAVVTHDNTIRALADMLERDSLKFDRARFCAAAMGDTANGKRRTNAAGR